MYTEYAKAVGGRTSRTVVLSIVAVVLGVAGVSQGQVIVPGADGSDGFFFPTTDTEVDLSLAVTRDWDMPSPVVGRGVYDPNKWAVVFKYTSVNIPAGVTVTFKNHPSGAPVVWLVQGAVTILGTVDLSGGRGSDLRIFSVPGPGGFRGGVRYESAGLGPGGGFYPAVYYSHGSYGDPGTATSGGTPPPTYGNARLIPLIGGSGGSSHPNGGGGAGGGAILIATAGSFTISGEVLANGGSWLYQGSGGGIRIIADTVEDGLVGPGTLQAQSGGSGHGRIRIEANSVELAQATIPTFTWGYPGDTAVLWPSDLGNVPEVRVASIGGVSVPTDPRASFDFPQADATLTSPGVHPLVVEAKNVPLHWSVNVRIVPKCGQDIIYPAYYVAGDDAESVWQAAVEVSGGFSAIQVRASEPGAARETEALDDEDVAAVPASIAEHKG